MITGHAFAELRTTTAPDALCSNGEQATYAYFDDSNSNDWLVYIHGGGVAANTDQYRGRPEGMKSPAPNDYIGVRLTNDFRDQGFNVVIIGYCTSDLYQGFHTHDMDGKTVNSTAARSSRTSSTFTRTSWQARTGLSSPATAPGPSGLASMPI